MNEYKIILFFMIYMMLLFCLHGGLLLYFCGYLRRRGITELKFWQTFMIAATGDIKKFYKILYASHSKDYGSALTKGLIIWHITSVILIFLSPVLLAIYIGI
jgi:hypothetical protein